MFGIGIWEFLVIAILAIIVLGPDKLPETMVKIAKYLKAFTKSINEAKQAVEEELNLQELKDDALKYRKLLEKSTKELNKPLSFDELEVLQDSKKEVEDAVSEITKETSSINSALEEKSTKKEKKEDTTPSKKDDKEGDK